MKVMLWGWIRLMRIMHFWVIYVRISGFVSRSFTLAASKPSLNMLHANESKWRRLLIQNEAGFSSATHWLNQTGSRSIPFLSNRGQAVNGIRQIGCAAQRCRWLSWAFITEGIIMGAKQDHTLHCQVFNFVNLRGVLTYEKCVFSPYATTQEECYIYIILGGKWEHWFAVRVVFSL